MKKRHNTRIYCRNCRANRSMLVIQKGVYRCNLCGIEHTEEGGGRIMAMLPKNILWDKVKKA